MTNPQKNAARLSFLLFGFLLFSLFTLAQSTVSYTVDQSTTGYTVKRAFGLPGGKSGVVSLTTDNHFFCSVVNADGSVAHSFDITGQMSPQTTTLTRLEINAIGTLSGNVFITYTCNGTDNMTNQNARYLILNQSTGATVASGNINATNGGPLLGLNRYVELAALSNGNVVVTWETYTQNPDLTATASTGSGLYRIFTENGVAVTGDVIFAGPGSAIYPLVVASSGNGVKVAANPNGGFLISFVNFAFTQSGSVVTYSGYFHAVRFDNSGAVQLTGGQKDFTVDATIDRGNYRNYAAVGLSNGNYLLLWEEAFNGHYKVINASGADVKARTNITDADLAKAVSTNGWMDGVAVNTAGKQGFVLSTTIWEEYDNLANPNVKIRIYNFDLSGNFLSSADLTSYFIGDDAPLPELYTGLPSGVGVAYRTYKSFTVTNGRVNFPTDSDLKGATLDFDQPSVSSIVRVTPLGQLTNGTAVSYQVQFSTPVTGVDASDFSLSTTGGVAGTIGTVSGSGTSYTVPVGGITGNGTLRLDLESTGTGIKSLGNTDIYAGFTAGETYEIDHISPTLTAVGITSDNSTNAAYAKTGDKLTISFTASEALNTASVIATVSGQTAMVTNTGGNNWKAERTMNGSEAEGPVTFSISFSDLAGNAGTPVTAVTAGGGSISFDKTAPSVTSLVRKEPTAQTTIATAVTFRVVFSEAVTGVDITDFSIFGSGTVSGTLGTVSAVSGSDGKQYDVQVNGLTGDGTFGLNLNSSGTGIIDVAGNTSSGYTAGETYNRVGAPTVTSISRYAPSGQLTNATTVTYQVEFSIGVTGVDETDFALFSPDGVTGTVSQVNGSGTTYQVEVSGIAGNGSLRLDVKGDGTTGIEDANHTALLEGYSSGETYSFDHAIPTLSNVGIASNNANITLAKVSDVVTLTFTASEPLQTPLVTIAGQNPTALTNTTGNTWQATYTMAAGDAEGSVPFAIDYSDLAGNAGTQVAITSNASSVTFDRIAPVVSNVHIQSSNSNNQVAKPGDVVTLSFTTSEEISGAAVSITGNGATINHTGNNYSATYTLQSSDPDGSIGFSISGFSDAAGNAGGTVSSTTDGSSVTFDKTAPTLTSAGIASNNANSTSLAKVGNTVTLTFSSSESIAAPTVTITTHAVTASFSSGAWSASYQLTSGDAEGVIPFSIAFSDLAGNQGTQVTTTTNSTTVTFDKTVPTLSPVTIASNNANGAFAKVGDVITVSFTSSEAVSGVAVAIDGHPAFLSSNGNNYTATYTMTSSDPSGGVAFSISGFQDAAGNAGASVSTTTNSSAVTFDKTAPAVTSINRQTPSAQGTTSTTLVYRVTFSENVSGVDVSDFTLTTVNGGNAGTKNITTVTPVSASVYDVTATVTSISGAEVRLDLNASGTGVKDPAGNDISAGFASGQSYILGQAPSFTNCPTVKTVNTDAGRCDATLSKATLLSYVTATGYPTPTLTVKVGTTVVDDTHPYTFPKGGKTVTVTATNGIGSPASCSFTLTVVDNQAPVINTIAKPIVLLWSPNHKYQTVKASQFVSSVTDNCGSLATSSVVITKVTSDEPDDLPGSADGSTTQDIKIAANCTSVDLRSERQDNGNGRVYTIYLKVSDATGNTGTAIAKALAPVNQSGTTAVDNGPAYTVLSSCNSNNLTVTTMNTDVVPQEAEGLRIHALPNPTTTQFTVQLIGGRTGAVNLRVVDILGRTVEARQGIAAGTTLQIGASYRPGIYILEAVQGSQRRTLKLVKQPD